MCLVLSNKVCFLDVLPRPNQKAPVATWCLTVDAPIYISTDLHCAQKSAPTSRFTRRPRTLILLLSSLKSIR